MSIKKNKCDLNKSDDWFVTIDDSHSSGMSLEEAMKLSEKVFNKKNN